MFSCKTSGGAPRSAAQVARVWRSQRAEASQAGACPPAPPLSRLGRLRHRVTLIDKRLSCCLLPLSPIHRSPSFMRSQTYLVKPVGKAACLRQATSPARAVESSAREFPAGVESVRVVRAQELADIAASGTPLPPAARRIVAAHKKPAPASERRRVQKERLRRRVQDGKSPRPGPGADAPYQLDLFHWTQ
jgi:hypothetical protein